MISWRVFGFELDVTSWMKMAKSIRVARKATSVPLVIVLLLVSAALLAILLIPSICNLAASSELIRDTELGKNRDNIRCSQMTRDSVRGESVVPYDVVLALLHFATTKEVPQQSREEVATTLGVLLQRAPCTFLVFGMWHDSLLWATFNYGGRTVFLDESQEWIDRMRVKHPELETYKLDYKTTLLDAPDLLTKARATRSTTCRPNQEIHISECALAINQLPRELLSVQWDVIMIDGPRSYPEVPSFPGRMSPIFTSAVMAHTRAASGFTDIFLHDVSRPLERQFGEEFLCGSNLVRRVGDLWHFQVHPSNTTRFCTESLSTNDST